MTGEAAIDFAPLMAKILAGEPVPWPAGSDVAAFVLEARQHGVVPLVQRSVHAHTAFVPAPEPALTEALARIARSEAANVVAQDTVAGLALRVLAGADIPVLLMKGGALAYTHYPHPELRPRVDTDLLVAPARFARALAQLVRAGFRQLPVLDAPLLMRQATLQYEVGAMLRGSIDVHRAVSNRPKYARAARFDELWERARDVALAGVEAKAPDDADALILASIHLAGHHPTERRLIWIYDLLLLLLELGPEGLAAAARRAGLKGCLPALVRALGEVGPFFSASLPVELRPALSALNRTTPRLAREPTRLHVLANDLRAMDSHGEQMRYLCQHLFPPPAYMHARYGVTSRAWLAWLYLRRIGAGIAKLGRPPRQL
ncbi:MAG: hypothetical protein GKR94_01755 [Gammaproteobacteria bacterium]|nr:hypothetical protein [Gammaproteobacteria bacterium]